MKPTLALLLGAGWLGLALAQQAPPLRFEVASLKPDRSRNGGVVGGCHGSDGQRERDPGISVPLGRCVIQDGRLSHMMSMAFNLPMDRISGYPDWDGPSRWDVEAEVENPAGVTEAQLQVLLQNFLVAQFQLKLRHESKLTPSYRLTVSQASKLKPSGQTYMTLRPTDSGLELQGATMADLATFLSGLPTVGRPVVDETQMPGRFDFGLDLLGKQAQSPADFKAGIANWQSVFRDLRDQLGLKLEAGRSRVETIVIESAVKPQGGSCSGC